MQIAKFNLQDIACGSISLLSGLSNKYWCISNICHRNVRYRYNWFHSKRCCQNKNLLGSENFRKKMSSLLITCCSWWRCLYPQSCLFMFLCYVVVVVLRHIHNLLLSFVVFYCLFVFIIVTMDAMKEAQFGAVFCLFSYLIP